MFLTNRNNLKLYRFTKKSDYLQKGNYNLLPQISNVCETVVNKQFRKFIENKISECMTGFRETHGTQYSLTIMLESGGKHWIKKKISQPYF